MLILWRIQYISHTVQSIMSTLQFPWDILCPVMGSVEVNDFPLGLGMNRGHIGMCLPVSVYACSCIPLGISCVSMWRWGCSEFVGEVRVNSLLRRKSLPIRGKQAWLEVSNYRVGDNDMGEIRVPRFSSIGKSPVGFCECSSTRTAHADYITRHQSFL